MYRAVLREGYIAGETTDACRQAYGDRLISLVLFGSVVRGTMRADSDVDLLLVAAPLPRGRMARVREFEVVGQRVEGSFAPPPRAVCRLTAHRSSRRRRKWSREAYCFSTW
jgi:predicted nucleotidyltransferase